MGKKMPEQKVLGKREEYRSFTFLTKAGKFRIKAFLIDNCLASTSTGKTKLSALWSCSKQWWAAEYLIQLFDLQPAFLLWQVFKTAGKH